MSKTEDTPQYRELGPLAEGGMARLSTAIRDDGVTVVIKRIRKNLQYSDIYKGLFHDEALIASSLHHRHIVRLLESGSDQDGPFLVFEHIEGTDLLVVYQNLFQARAPLELGQFFAVFIPILAALTAVHEASDAEGNSLQLVHRDMSPGNILLGTHGAVKLADFGIAKSVLKTQQTVAGELKGKFAYMASEQTKGEELDSRADLFAVGVMMYESLTGRPLFDAATDADTVHAVREVTPPRLHIENQSIPEDLSLLVEKLLQKNKENRPDTAKSAHDSLKELAQELCLDQGHQRHISYLAKGNPRPNLNSNPEPGEQKKRHTQRVMSSSDSQVTPNQSSSDMSRKAILAISVGIIIGGLFFGLRSADISTPSSITPIKSTGLTTNPSPSFNMEPNIRDERGAQEIKKQVASKKKSIAGARAAEQPAQRKKVTPPPSSQKNSSTTTKRRPSERSNARQAPPASSSMRERTTGYGKLFLSSEPWSVVTIDGEDVGTHTPIVGLRLQAGDHSIRLFNPHYNIEKNLRVTIPKGGEVRRFVDLTK